MTRTWSIIAWLLISACAQEAAPVDPVPPPALEPVAEVAPPAPVPPVVEPAPTPDEMPIEQDFEEEVTAAITPQNVRGELKRLEAEITSDSVE